MRLLLDTHAVLWFIVGVAIKVSLHKLNIGGAFRGFFPQQMLRTYFDWLDATDEHLTLVAALPFHHKDPFDRLLAAQALAENIPLVSADVHFDAYGVTRQ